MISDHLQEFPNNCSDFTWKLLVFGKTGSWGEVVATRSSTVVEKVSKVIWNKKHLTKFYIRTTDLTAVGFADKFFSFSSTWISSASTVLSESASGNDTRDLTSKPVVVNSENEPCPMQQPCDKDKSQNASN